MSTPSDKPFDPLDLSPYVPKRARERSILERPSFAREDHQNHADHSAARTPGDGDAVASAADGVPLAQEMPRQYALDLDAGNDGDLTRLQSSVRYLRREAGLDPEKRANGEGEPPRERLPRVAQLRPVSELGPFDPDAPRPRADQYINGIRVPPSLAPKHLRRPRPLARRRDHLRGPLRVLLASAVAAPIAYYFSVAKPALQSGPAESSSLTSFAAKLVASAEFPSPRDKLRPEEAQAYDAMLASRNKLMVEPVPAPTPSPSVAAPLAVAVSAEPVPARETVREPAAPAVRALDPDTIKLLLQQGEQLVAGGDLVSARQVYQRAAEAGNAAAALALGATFDPVVLAKIGMPGLGADVDKARSWYEKAREFGSADAPHRLETLANR